MPTEMVLKTMTEGTVQRLGASELRQITEVRGLYGTLTCMEH